jgi:hypothetical protein
MRKAFVSTAVGLTWLLGACGVAGEGANTAGSNTFTSASQALGAGGEASGSVTLCHKPGTPAEKTLTLPASAAAGHLGHGDTEGACGDEQPTTCAQRPLPAEPPATELPMEEDEGAWASEAVAVLEGASTTTFNPAGSPVSFKLSCPTLEMTPDSVVVYLNDRPLPFSSLALAPDRVTLTGGLPSGRNEVVLLARDVYGFTIRQSVVLWAGIYTVPVRVLNPDGSAAPGASVTARLSDDPNVTATLVTDATGQGVFTNLPNRSYNMVATAAGNLLATQPTSVFDGTAVLRLNGFTPPSPIDNNDFSLGLLGWNLGTAPVFLISHIEGPMGFASSAAQAASMPVDRASRAALTSDELSGLPVPYASLEAMAADNDLVLATRGEGQQSISRSFDVEAGVKSVTVRYRFLTTEVPGGWYGSEFNDFYNVSLRTVSGGQSINDGNSMNGLGLGAFDGAGATGWRETELQIPENGDTLQVNLAVANVADGYLNSYVIVDVVKKKKLSISALALNDIDNSGLSYLSASNHTYFGGNTRVHGTITVEGDKEDSLEELKLEVLEGGNVIATGTLSSGLTGTLYRQFGDTEKIQLETTQLFFEIPGGELAGAAQGTNGNLSLRVKAKSVKGETAERDFGNVTKVIRVTGINRYGGRDEARGGDDWAKPQVGTFIQGAGLTWGDFSNMNAGSFAPDHASHQTGNSADGHFAGYNDRNAATAATIIGHLNTHGTRIRTVYVTFTPTSAFATAIANVTLNDGRAANQVIRNHGGHTTHFHWEVTDN